MKASSFWYTIILNLIISNSLMSDTIHDAVIENKYKRVEKLATKENVNKKNNNGKTPLMIAAECGDENLSIMLINRGADVNTTNKSKETPLHYAISYSFRLVEKLVKQGANIDAKDNNGITPLFKAIKNANHQTAKFLLENKANPNILTKAKIDRTPLHEAAKNENLQFIQLLLRYGANINEKNSKGQTILHLAVIENQPLDLIKYYINNKADIEIKDKEGNIPSSYAAAVSPIKEYLLTEQIKFLQAQYDTTQKELKLTKADSEKINKQLNEIKQELQKESTLKQTALTKAQHSEKRRQALQKELTLAKNDIKKTNKQINKRDKGIQGMSRQAQVIDYEKYVENEKKLKQEIQELKQCCQNLKIEAQSTKDEAELARKNALEKDRQLQQEIAIKQTILDNAKEHENRCLALQEELILTKNNTEEVHKNIVEKNKKSKKAPVAKQSTLIKTQDLEKRLQILKKELNIIKKDATSTPKNINIEPTKVGPRKLIVQQKKEPQEKSTIVTTTPIKREREKVS